MGIFRLILLTWFIWTFASDYTDDRLLARPPEMTGPTILARLIGFAPVATESARSILLTTAWISMFTAWLGLFTRVSLAIFAITTLYIESVRYSFGYFAHSHVLPCLALMILALAPGVASWSADALLRARRDRRPLSSAFELSPAPVWPVRLIQLHLALLLFASGIAKLRWGGLEWVDGETLGSYLNGELAARPQFFAATATAIASSADCAWRDGVGLEFPLYKVRLTALGAWLSKSDLLLAISAWGTLLLELGGPILMLTRRWLWAGVVLALIFHLAVYAMMLVNFFPHALCFAVLIDWRSIWNRIAPRVV